MLRFDKAWGLADVGCEPSCDLHLAGELGEPDAEDGEGGRRALAVTRECLVAAGGADAATAVHTAVVGVEHDGLLLIARYWPGCTEVGYVRAKPEAAFQQPGQFCVLHRVRQRQWIVHASLSADMAYLALTTWRRPVTRNPAVAPAESDGPFQAFVLRIHAPGTHEGQQPRPPRELRVLARAMRAAQTGLPTSAGGNEPGCFTGASAVEWLLRQTLRNNPTREQAVALGLRLLQHGVIAAVGHDASLFADDEDLLFRFNEPAAPTPGEESSDGSDIDDNAMMQQAEQMMTPEQDIAGEAHARRRRRRRSSRLKRESKPQLAPGLGSGPDIPATSEVQGLHVKSWVRPTIRFLNFADFEASTPGGGRTGPDGRSVPVGSSFLLCHQGIKHFTITRGSFINTNPIILVKNCIWHSYNPSHRLLYYLAVSGGKAEYAFNCYSFDPDAGCRPHHEFDAWLHVPGLPEVRRSRQTSEQRSRETGNGENEIESGLQTWQSSTYTPASFSIVRLRGATVCLCHQHRAPVVATEIVVTVYMLHRRESLTINVQMPADAKTAAGRRLFFGSLADYIVIYAAGKVLLLVDCSTDAPRCGSLAFVGVGLVPHISKAFVKMPAAQTVALVRENRTDTNSPNSGGESEYEDALSHQDQASLARIPSSVSWQDSEVLLGTPLAGRSPEAPEESLSDEDTAGLLAFQKQAVDKSANVGGALAQALLGCNDDGVGDPVALAKGSQNVRVQKLQASTRVEIGDEPQPEPELTPGLKSEPEFGGLVSSDEDEGDLYSLHLHVVPWLDELPSDGELANGMWELDCFSMVVDCESSSIFRLSFDPDVVLSVGSAALNRLAELSAHSTLEQTRVTEDLLIKFFHFSWLHLNDGTMAKKLVAELLNVGLLSSVLAARVFREYILSGAYAALRRQYAPRVLSRALLEKDRELAADARTSSPATSVTYGTYGAVVATGPVMRNSQLCITQVGGGPAAGTDGAQTALAVELGVEQCEWAPFPDLERSSGTSRIEYFAVPAVPTSVRSTTSAARSVRSGSEGQVDDVAQSPARMLRTLTAQTPRRDESSFKLAASSPPPPTPRSVGTTHSDGDDSPYTPFATASSSGESTERLVRQATSSLAALNAGGGTDSGSDFEAQRRAVAGLNGGRGLKYLAAADAEADRLFSVVPRVGRMDWRAACRAVSARYFVAKWEQVESLYMLLRHETQGLHQMLTVAVRSLDLSDTALDADAEHASRAADTLNALRPLHHVYQTLCCATKTIDVPLPDDFDTHHVWLASLLLSTTQIVRMLQCGALRITPALYAQYVLISCVRSRAIDESMICMCVVSLQI